MILQYVIFCVIFIILLVHPLYTRITMTDLNPGRINVIIVDDEKEACTNLEFILKEYVDADINVVGLANSTAEAEKLIRALSPDAVFSDVEMPNENAFQFLQRIAPLPFEVVFITAYDEYAIRAFKLNAIDYILKPISIVELKNAVEKLKQRIAYKKALIIDENNISYSELATLVSNKARHQKITLKDNNRVEVVNIANILFIEAQGSYCKVYFLKDNNPREIIVSTSISDYEELLPADIFYRIHKSYLINCTHVSKILKEDAAQVVMKDKNTLPVSRRRFLPLIEFLKSNEYFHG